jgi:uncharacterized coiled-coil protein SlyX
LFNVARCDAKKGEEEMSKQLEKANADLAKATGLIASQKAAAAIKTKAAEGDPDTNDSPAEGGDDMETRLANAEAKCADLEERVMALEDTVNKQAETSAALADSLSACVGIVNKFSAKFSSPVLARIGAVEKPSASAAAPVATKTAFEQWSEMPEGKAKDEFLNANALAINATAK